MAVSSRGRKEVSVVKKVLEREFSPERSRNWIEASKPKENEPKVGVMYYLSRNGQLEHPHLMEVPLSSPQGILCLKDVIHRLNFLRGQGMANSYSWSAKRRYKKGFVWQDLSENDLIYPCSGHDEYVLKGTQLTEISSSSFRSYETTSPPSSKASSETTNSSTDTDSPASTIKKMKKQPWKLASDASTQTEEGEVEENIKEGPLLFSGSMSSYEAADIRDRRVENDHPSGRMKASTVLMQLIKCGSSKRLEDWECERRKIKQQQ